jgi:taurine--2-oxoglutarate transaminase
LAPFNGSSPEMTTLAGYLKSKHLYAFSRFNMLWVCPPLIIQEEDLRHGLDIVEEGLALVDAALFPTSTEQPVAVGTKVG